MFDMRVRSKSCSIYLESDLLVAAAASPYRRDEYAVKHKVISLEKSFNETLLLLALVSLVPRQFVSFLRDREWGGR